MSITGNGGSSGPVLEGYLRSVSKNLDVRLSMSNRGSGQDMIATQIYQRDLSYLSDGEHSFISLEPDERLSIIFAYCVDFEKDNPSGDDSFAIRETPPKLIQIAISAYEETNPSDDRCTTRVRCGRAHLVPREMEMRDCKQESKPVDALLECDCSISTGVEQARTCRERRLIGVPSRSIRRRMPPRVRGRRLRRRWHVSSDRYRRRCAGGLPSGRSSRAHPRRPRAQARLQA